MITTSTVSVLVADDEPRVRSALVRLLEGEGLSVVGAVANGEEAIAATRALTPDVVVMDVRMPTMDGIEATRHIHRRHPDVRVVMLSAYEDPTLKQEASEAGASGFLVKGCVASALLEAVCG